MLRLADFQNKQVLLLGLGKEGLATADVLCAYVPSARVAVYDDTPTNDPAFSWLSLDEIRERVDASWIVVKTPGIPPHHEVVRAVVAAGAVLTSAMNLFFAERKGKGKIIGITGTKGKSTTSALLAHVLRVAGMPVVLAGNIGEPALKHVRESDDTIFVLEMSSYHLADLEIAPDIAVILNLYEEHMDWHGDVAAYHGAKMRIAELQSPGDIFVYNPAFPALTALAGRVSSSTVSFVHDARDVLDVLHLLGEHNRINASAVVTVADALGVARDVVKAAFVTFEPLPHRLQDLGIVRGVQFINDSFCTTPAAAMAAMDVFGDRLGAIILGGHDRGYHFEELARKVVASGARVYILLNGDRLAEAIEQAGGACMRMHDFAEIVRDVLANLPAGKVCLLSPASPSFGQFKNFVERGEQFMQAVRDCV